MKIRYREFQTNLVFCLFLSVTACQHTISDPGQPETPDQAELIREKMLEPQVCGSCHPNHYAQWQQSMHAYAIVDPIFQKLSKIGQDRSNHELDQYCVKCHTPLGSLMGETQPGFSFDNLSQLATAGISCEVCHTLKEIRRGEGATSFFLDGVRRGSIVDPVPNTFHESEFSIRYKQSHFCSPCHQVKSPDGSFDIETTSLEWAQSSYVIPLIECQTCHMPTYSGKAATEGPDRENLHLHTFIGVDYPLVDFPGKEETIQRVQELLENSAHMAVTSPTRVTPGESFTVAVTIENRYTGHNLPSGAVFERQMWIEVVLKDKGSGTTYFSTGLLDDNGDLMNHHSEFVKTGQIPPDTSLVLYNGIPIDANGQETLFFWEAVSLQNNTLRDFEVRVSEFGITAPSQPAQLELTVRLRFRSFPPYLFREIDEEELISELRVFDMESFQQTIAVAP